MTLLNAVNAQREAYGLSLLVADDAANAMAQHWAEMMAQSRQMSHGDFASRIVHSFPNRIGAENIAAGQTSVSNVVADWMADSPHRRNILGHFTILGVGQAIDSNGTTYWCLDFIN